MCSINLEIQMKVFERNSDSRSRPAVIKRLEACGMVNANGEMTQWYKTLIDRSE